MIPKLKPILIVLAICGSQSDQSALADPGFGYEVLITKMEYLENLLIEQQSEIKRLIDHTVQRANRQKLETIEETIIPKLNELSSKILQWEINQTEISSKLTTIEDTTKFNFNVLYDNLKSAKSTVKTLPIRSCQDAPLQKSGPYWLQPIIGSKAFLGYCEQEKFSGGWLVMQYRFNGWVDFFRQWTDYKTGFGHVNGEFWLGLETVHRLTTAKRHRLVVELEEFSGKYSYAMYDQFEIGSEAEQYSLKRLGTYSGTAGDSLTWHKGMGFSTKDRDNGLIIDNCAVESNGGWWYHSCHHSNLNGGYGKEHGDYDDDDDVKNCWKDLTDFKCEALKMTRMMLKEV